eukprot:gnl/TRDRNA2_/TRDRNA2_174827_c0_seq13.p1 gnl/TRDRNA2_/TRDRNA2_174827_c0~~gnl/TRDRNA2_/TRDRNA2_174827_c0_seq13.p1  ORF type:complete len:367 (+),score=44.36 gnl/TRDRNA2_/TRDRNA2_174827_c0_seq13:99-1199(+)
MIVRRESGAQERVPQNWIIQKVWAHHHCFAEDIFSVFSGGGEREALFELQRDAQEDPNLVLHYTEFAMGSRNTGNLVQDPSLALPGSLAPLHGLRKYRDRMMLSHVGPEGLKTATNPRRQANEKLHAMIIHNKRFSEDDIRMFKQVAQDISREGNVEVEYLDWARVGDYKGDNRAHMKKVLECDIYISSVGTALMYLPFLRDGSVFIALGQIMEETTMGPKRVTPAFMEQHMSTGSTYVQTLYYDSKDRMNGIKPEPLTALIKKASDIIRTGFQIPVDVEKNLSPEGLVLKGICDADYGACEKIAQLRNRGPWDCVRAIWTEYIVYEVGPWRDGGQCSWRTSKANMQLLRSLRKQHGLPGFGAAED